jgi:L-ascorbate metabolism protein UlaG (beta-lactamase superfamily)
MRMLLGSVFAITLTAAALVANQAGTVPAAEGNIQITPIMRASVQIEYAGKVIQVDPMGKNDYSQAKPADLILVTDIDADNLDPDQIAKIRKPGAPVVMPAAAATLAGAKIPAPTTVTANGETKTVVGVSIEAVPMYNTQRGPKPGEVYHPKGRGNGYIVTIGGKRLYFAGDTECTPEMKDLKNIDVAFVPMLMPSTMTPFEAAECVKAFLPKVVYVYHYEGQKNDEAFFRAALKGTQVDVRVQTQK